MALRRTIATLIVKASKALVFITFLVVLLLAISTRWWLAIPWAVLGLPISFIVIGLLTTPVMRLLVGGWRRDSDAIADWLSTIPRPRP